MKNTTNRVWLGAALLAAGLVHSAGVSAQEPGLTDKTIKIGVFSPLSGANMAYGFDVINAAKMYYNKVNKEGGIHGRQIEVRRQDADDAIRLATEPDVLSNDFGIGGEARSP